MFAYTYVHAYAHTLIFANAIGAMHMMNTDMASVRTQCRHNPTPYAPLHKAVI